ncbi:MAG: Eco57I restriction-modification methylase domain-containing protein [Promethearchaeota archaeon]
MEQHKNFEKFETFLSLFDKIYRSNNITDFKDLIPTIDTFEDLFLRCYQNRKKEGIYYTDKEISNFMVNQSLIFLINDRLKANSGHFKKISKINDIKNFSSTIQQEIYNFLLNITISDPACGSGNFLVKSADYLYNFIKMLDLNPQNPQIKIQILKNLYGYDTNEYAIKLCTMKLLAWYLDDSHLNFSDILPILQSNLRRENLFFNSNSIKYDIIIGNPPYGNILTQNEKMILKEEDIFYHDIYCAFLLKSLEWTNKIIVFLVPKSFLLRQGYVSFRNKFLSKTNIIKIVDIGSKIFKNATNEVQVIIYNKKNHKITDLQIYDYPNKKIITYKNQNIDLLRICFNIKCPYCVKSKKLYFYTFKEYCPHCGSETVGLNRIRIKMNDNVYKIINKIEQNGDLNYLNPLDFPKMIRGEEDKGLKLIRHNIRNDSKGSCFFIHARNDFKYYYLQKNKSFNIEEISSNILKGENYEYYIKPKLLIKHNNIIPEAIYTEDNICFTSSIYSLLSDDNEELNYLCALINSALLQFYCIYGINNQKDTTINLNQYMIRHLPLTNANRKIKSEIASKVNKIIEKLIITNGELNTLICQLLREIDDIIFSIYSITPREKNIICTDLKGRTTYFEKIYSQ